MAKRREKMHKGSLLDFNQHRLLQKELDIIDLIIINYVVYWYATASESNSKIILHNGNKYLWIARNKILTDLPILKLKDRGLENRINNLVKKGIFERVWKQHGLKKLTFFKPTDIVRWLRGFDNEEEVKQKVVVKVDKPKPTKKELKKDYYDMAEYMYNKILQLNENYKRPNMDKWADTFRLMIEVDKINPQELGELIDKIYKNEFWQKNILSPSKLRSKYDDLVIRLKNQKNLIDFKNAKFDDEFLKDFYKKG